MFCRSYVELAVQTTSFLFDKSMHTAVKLIYVKRCFCRIHLGKPAAMKMESWMGANRPKCTHWSSVISMFKSTFVQKFSNCCVSVTLVSCSGHSSVLRLVCGQHRSICSHSHSLTPKEVGITIFCIHVIFFFLVFIKQDTVLNDKIQKGEVK